VSTSTPEEESLARTAVGLGAFLVAVLVALGTGLAILLRLVLWLPDAAVSLGLVGEISTGVVFLSMAVSVAVAVAAMFAVTYVVSALFVAVERLFTS
jgi:hypothetical protein